MKILQIVGYQNSGKTTLIETIVSALTQQGYKIGTLKHHGHRGNPKIPDGTDSTRHTQAGASVSGVQGDDMFVLTINNKAWDIEELISWYQAFPLDLLLIEGYKQATFPKLVCLRDENDDDLLQLPNVKGAFSLNPELESSYDIHNQESYLKWIKAILEG